jgi:hypothetical protein
MTQHDKILGEERFDDFQAVRHGSVVASICTALEERVQA